MKTLKLLKVNDRNYTRMLHSVSHKFWKQHPTKQQLCGYLPLFSQTIKVRQDMRDTVGDELISDVLQWNPAHGCAGIGRPVKNYLH